METKLVGYYKTKHGAIHLFFNCGNKWFHWVSVIEPGSGFQDLRFIAPGVKNISSRTTSGTLRIKKLGRSQKNGSKKITTQTLQTHKNKCRRFKSYW